jgi:PII-like signaling protein
VVTIIIDTPERIERSFDIVDELTEDHGVVTSEMVPAVIAVAGPHRDGNTDLARHHY